MRCRIDQRFGERRGSGGGELGRPQAEVMAELVWLIPAFPLFGFLVLRRVRAPARRPQGGLLRHGDDGRLVRRLRRPCSSTSSAGPSEERAEVVTLFSWLPVGSLQVDMAFLADPLSVTMCLFVTGVGALIHLYAVGYMHGDPKFSKFFLYMNLFALAMLVLVLGENLLVTFLGWEGVGTCSYFLIAFWQTQGVGGDGGQEGVRHQPGRRLRVHAGDVPRLPGRRLAQLLRRQRRRRGGPARRIDRHRHRRACCSSGRSASRPSCRCTSGCPTRWRVRRLCRR